ncbi:MAG: hypothetical protein KF819_31660 [Labilithrix sp.]|nr:hypothetical protein [Labilithrix sp.]
MKIASLAVALCLLVAGCSGGHSMRTIGMRRALDAGDPLRAIAHLNDELGVEAHSDRPKKLQNDDALLVLDRAAIKQSIADVAGSKRDYEMADKAIDTLDLSRNATDAVGRWLFSDAAGRYVAPPHEKVLVNVLNLVNYLESSDLAGARVEARRMSVTARYLRDTSKGPSASLGIGSMLAGFVYERSGDLEEASRYYADAGSAAPSPLGGDEGEILVVVGWGRVPHRVANHVPLAAALPQATPFLSLSDRQAATTSLTAWVHYPSLAQENPMGPPPIVKVDGKAAALGATLDVTGEVKAEWAKIEGHVLAAATSRCIARVVAGKSIEAATQASNNRTVEGIGFLVSLFGQIAANAADVPDTRSWETMPARLAIARVRVTPGEHRVHLEAQGMRREGSLAVAPGGWRAISLFALR